ncbi:hypothetical protein EZJ43_12265 [Pedobacter changchengzhani]|uniref:Uncharacterized protein n=1 Tax=Pedobacter changchengzhani TaxID=2529274 RepID=A0A4R5MK55_9SPHI|nr:hypothetical protein [Pedobacter changchengzhani]TDG35786.1 hypothetical protein EZJ43_12265 [Pedobacter changchengzhani]
MKNTKIVYLVLCLLFGSSICVHAQFQGLKDKLKSVGIAQGAKALGVDKLLKQPEAITTNFTDVDRNGAMMPDFKSTLKAQPIYLLPKNATGGFVLCEGLFEMTNKSYCLHAGTFAPSKGDGYMYAPTAGPKEAIVVAILKNAETHPEVQQHDIQVLLWTIIARTKFADYAGQVKVTAMKLLTLKQLTQLEGSALGVLPFNVMEKAKDQLPNGVKAVFEAENNIRQLVASGNYTFADMEKYAIVAGMAPARSDVPSGIWTKHPDGYYVRYFPSGYSITKVQVYVPKELLANGNRVVYDATNDIACPANTGSQRLAQTNEPLNPNYKLKLTTICNSK